MKISREVLQTLIKDVLSKHTSRDLQGRGKASAVLVPLFWKNGECYLLLTRRTYQVEHHKGEISFPGGAREQQDSTLLDTALRETKEEIGLSPSEVNIVGVLDDTVTLISKFVITPFVGWIPYPYNFQLNYLEIQESLEIPLSFFLEENNHWVKRIEFHCGVLISHFYKWRENTIVWGATARIIHNFCQLLREEL